VSARGSDDFPRKAPHPPVDAHKGDLGRVLAIAGSAEMPGAAVLVARAAQRAGAGWVAVGVLEPPLDVVLPTTAPEAIQVNLATDTLLSAGDRLSMEFKERRYDAVAFGPGLGAQSRTRELLARLLEHDLPPLVLDADGLNALFGKPETLRDARGPVVITPHPGEAARLLGRAVPRDPEGRRKAARELARKSYAICVLKGHGTVVSDGQRDWVCAAGSPAMATAGSGDVLTGVLLAYLATSGRDWCADLDFDLFEATCSAVERHARAGEWAARRFGVRGTVASDLIEGVARFDAGELESA
jgi:hydroxyethylthiazole kinase-like uncharacterized protein yjeF